MSASSMMLRDITIWHISWAHIVLSWEQKHQHIISQHINVQGLEQLLSKKDWIVLAMLIFRSVSYFSAISCPEMFHCTPAKSLVYVMLSESWTGQPQGPCPSFCGCQPFQCMLAPTECANTNRVHRQHNSGRSTLIFFSSFYKSFRLNCWAIG